MAQTKSGASSTNKHTTAEMRNWYETHKSAIEKFEHDWNAAFGTTHL